MSFRLTFADGPRRSRIFADEVLGELPVGSGSEGLSRSRDVERCADGNGRGQFNGEISDAGTGGGGGCSVAGNCLDQREQSFLRISLRVNLQRIVFRQLGLSESSVKSRQDRM